MSDCARKGKVKFLKARLIDLYGSISTGVHATAILLGALVLVHFLSTPSYAADGAHDKTPGSYARGPASADLASLRVSGIASEYKDADTVTIRPVYLTGGAVVSIVAERDLAGLTAKVSDALIETHSQIGKLFGAIPKFDTTLRLMQEESFFKLTGAPSWTNALYFRGQIMIPVSDPQALDWDNLIRSAKHEYVHAIIHALTAGQCPGWLDEGLAQWLEGSENPALRVALRNHLQDSPPVRLAILQGGFTRLDNHIVAAAYAQSLYAARHLLDDFGAEKISTYFRHLRSSVTKEQAFERAFAVNLTDFERQLAHRLNRDFGQAPRRSGSPRSIADLRHDAEQLRASRSYLENSGKPTRREVSLKSHLSSTAE